MYFTVPGRTSRRRACPTRRQERCVYGLQILDATLEAGNTAEEKDTAASALLKHEFLDGGADDVTLATLGEVLLEPTLTTLEIFWSALALSAVMLASRLASCDEGLGRAFAILVFTSSGVSSPSTVESREASALASALREGRRPGLC